jgi:hypothetical protein
MIERKRPTDRIADTRGAAVLHSGRWRSRALKSGGANASSVGDRAMLARMYETGLRDALGGRPAAPGRLWAHPGGCASA